MAGFTRGIITARPMWCSPGRWMLVAVAAFSLLTGATVQATTTIPQGAVVEVDQLTVNQIMDAFHKADAAIAAGNLDGVMALYATQYNYHGLKQADVRRSGTICLMNTVTWARSISFRRSSRWDRALPPSSKSPARGACLASRRPAASGCRSTAGMKKSIF